MAALGAYVHMPNMCEPFEIADLAQKQQLCHNHLPIHLCIKVRKCMELLQTDAVQTC